MDCLHAVECSLTCLESIMVNIMKSIMKEICLKYYSKGKKPVTQAPLLSVQCLV